MTQPVTNLTRGSPSVPAPLLITATIVIAPSVGSSPSRRIAGSCFRYEDWLMKRSLQRLLLVGLSPSGGLSFPHFFRLHADIVDLLLSQPVNERLTKRVAGTPQSSEAHI